MSLTVPFCVQGQSAQEEDRHRRDYVSVSSSMQAKVQEEMNLRKHQDRASPSWTQICDRTVHHTRTRTAG